MWRPPTLTFAERPPAVADPPGRDPHQREGAEEAGEQVEEHRLAARRRLVAADRDADRVERRRRRRFDQASPSSCSCARRCSRRPNWPASTAPAPPRATAARPTVARSERAQPNRVRALARRVRRVGKRCEATWRSLAPRSVRASSPRRRSSSPRRRCRRRARSRPCGCRSRGSAARGGLCVCRCAGRAPRGSRRRSPWRRPSRTACRRRPARWWIVSTVLESSEAACSSRSARAARPFRLPPGAAAPARARPAVAGSGELARDQVVAQVAGGDVDRFAALAEALDVLEQDRLRHQRSPT